ncbi:MAG: hypothetical protein WBV94_01980 [Blastocatellia bacterium]
MKFVVKILFIVLFGFCGLLSFSGVGRMQKGDHKHPQATPKTWDDEAIKTIEVPLANPSASPVHVSSEYYYSITNEVKIYKSYPIYAPGKEPKDYWDWLKQQEPEVIFDAAKLKTEEDWMRAGEVVFDYGPVFEGVMGPREVRNPDWYKYTGVPLTKDGIMPFARYVVRQKGRVEVSNVACGTCHTRVMPDGEIIKGAQGNFPFERAAAYNFRFYYEKTKDKQAFIERNRSFEMALFGAPWVKDDPNARLAKMTIEELAQTHEAIPAGVMARHRASVFFPPQIPDLIGVKERKYLDHTGLVRHRSIADLMRYAALTQGGDNYARFGDYLPFEPFQGKLPDPKQEERYSDDQLYALALYLYALQPPPNPNKFDALAARGKEIFERQKCAACHPAPLYSNNMLTPVDGFKVPEEHLKQFNILPISVGTDPNLALKTRRGTGYYKVPSLKGLWYRGPFSHNGSVATLEDWFDPARLRDDYVTTGFRETGQTARAVKGHIYGLSLSEKDRQALIAFLKTL